MENKKVPIILIIAGVLVAAGGGFFYIKYNIENKKVISEQDQTSASIQAINDETEDWKTYIDNSQNWEIKLPPAYSIGYNLYIKALQDQIKSQLLEKDGIIRGNFYIRDRDVSIEFIRELDKFFSYQNDKPKIVLRVSAIIKKSADIAMLDYVKNVLAKPYYDNEFATIITPMENVGDISINGKKIIFGSPTGFESCPQNKRYFIEKDKENYINIDIAYCFRQNSQDLNSLDFKNRLSDVYNEINQILSTFKFTK